MKLIHRLGFYFGGFSIGLVFLMFFLSGKKTSCAYGPNARVLKNINTKTLVFSENTLNFLENKAMDSLYVLRILRQGKVLFRESNVEADSCKTYAIKLHEAQLTVQNCDSIATVLELKDIP